MKKKHGMHDRDDQLAVDDIDDKPRQLGRAPVRVSPVPHQVAELRHGKVGCE